MLDQVLPMVFLTRPCRKRAGESVAKAVGKDWNSFVFIACSKHFPSASSGTTCFDFRKEEEEFSRALPSFLHRLRRETIWRSLPELLEMISNICRANGSSAGRASRSDHSRKSTRA